MIQPTPGTGASAPDLSVLIPVYVPVRGSSDPLLALLERLAAQTLASDRFEVAVIDDGSPEPVALDPARYPFALTTLRQENAGPGAARNRGLGRCRAPLVLILNADAVPADDLLERHLAAQAEAPERCAVLGTFHFTQAALQHPFVQLLQDTDLVFTFSRLRHGELHPWQFFWTCNISLPTAVLREVGGFDAERFREALVEDVELGYRLEQRGWRVLYREDCRCEHDHVMTPEGHFRRAVRLGVNLYKMWEKHGDPRMIWCPDEAHAAAHLARALDLVESYNPALERLKGALAVLDEQYRGRALPPETKAQAVELVHQLGFAAVYRGFHLGRTGIDPVAMAEEGPPPGRLTSVVVVSYDALPKTRRCVEALRVARDERHPIEILVVDNGSGDGSAEWLAQQDDLTLVRNADNLGAPHARNQAIPLARGDWIAFLDNDVYVAPGWLERALYHGEVDPDVGAVCLVTNRASKNQQVPYQGGSHPAEIAGFASRRAAEYYRRGADTDLFTSFGVLVRRSVVERIGGFDERFSPWGFEDDDYSLRLRLAGFRSRVAQDAFVYHDHYDDPLKARRHSELLQRNWERFAAKWGSGGELPRMYDYEALELARAGERVELHVALPDGALPQGARDAASRPWPLKTDLPRRVLAWPRYGEEGDLERLLEAYAEALADDPERCLCLRHDPQRDGDLEQAVARLGAAYERALGEGRDLEVLLVDGPIPAVDLPRLGAAVDAVLEVPGQDDPEREAFCAALGARRVRDARELSRVLSAPVRV